VKRKKKVRVASTEQMDMAAGFPFQTDQGRIGAYALSIGRSKRNKTDTFGVPQIEVAEPGFGEDPSEKLRSIFLFFEK
jgi:hypothetical protein